MTDPEGVKHMVMTAQPDQLAPMEPEPTPNLTITSIETIAVRVPLDRVYQGSHYKMTHRSTIVTRVHTASGIVGEAYAGDEDAGLFDVQAIITNELTPMLVGQDAFAVERIWQLTRPATWDILRDRRLGLVACACIDDAIWDAIGKAVGVPLWRLWGGFRDHVPVITIGGYYAADADLAGEVAELVQREFAGMKLKIGGMTPEDDAKRARRVRQVAGEEFALAVDANQGYTPAEAIKFARMTSDLDLLWFEEPCQWHNDRRGMRDVRLAGSIPVCAGQSEFSIGGCRDLMEAGSIDFCNFDSSWSGGATEWRRVASMATAFDVRMAHHEEPQIAAHLLASIPHGTYLEFFNPKRDPIWHHMVANRPRVSAGHLALPLGPGLGWELDEDYIKKYRVHADGRP